MPRPLDWSFDFPAHYEVVALDRIDRLGGKTAYSYPGGAAVPTWQELADGPILEVSPAHSAPWVGVFHGGGYSSPVAARGKLIGWPDGVSLCVVYAGGADVVHSEDPTKTYEIKDTHVITDVLVVVDAQIVVFCDFTHAVAYGIDGHIWTSPRLALDELAFSHSDGAVLHATGFFGDRSDHPIRIDLQTGRSLDELPLDLG